MIPNGFWDNLMGIVYMLNCASSRPKEIDPIFPEELKARFQKSENTQPNSESGDPKATIAQPTNARIDKDRFVYINVNFVKFAVKDSVSFINNIERDDVELDIESKLVSIGQEPRTWLSLLDKESKKIFSENIHPTSEINPPKFAAVNRNLFSSNQVITKSNILDLEIKLIENDQMTDNSRKKLRKILDNASELGGLAIDAGMIRKISEDQNEKYFSVFYLLFEVILGLSEFFNENELIDEFNIRLIRAIGYLPSIESGTYSNFKCIFSDGKTYESNLNSNDCLAKSPQKQLININYDYSVSGQNSTIFLKFDITFL